MLSNINTILRYEPETGRFFWTRFRGGSAKAGARAGSLDSSGYFQIQISKKMHLSHRLAWFFTHGEFPKGMLDHINGDRQDNRICNLREVTASENAINRAARSCSELGYKGVSADKRTGRFRAYLGVGGKMKTIGVFATVEDAVRAMELAAKGAYGDIERPFYLRSTSPQPTKEAA